MDWFLASLASLASTLAQALASAVVAVISCWWSVTLLTPTSPAATQLTNKAIQQQQQLNQMEGGAAANGNTPWKCGPYRACLCGMSFL
jgi:hypothetical protein